MRSIGKISGVEIIVQRDGSVTYHAGATIDGDGANGQFGQLPCYAPGTYQGGTLDILANAGQPGDWYGVVTDPVSGEPIMQGAGDPCPGAYVSATALVLLGADGSVLPDSSPFKYVDAATVPYISVPALVVEGVAGIVKGCGCRVTNSATGQSVAAVVADTGGDSHIGEISVACARALGVPLGVSHPADGGGAPAPSILYQIFPGVPAVVNGVTYPLQPSAS